MANRFVSEQTSSLMCPSRRSKKRARPVAAPSFHRYFSLRFIHHQFVVDAEGAEQLASSDSGDLLVHRRVDLAVQGNVSVRHDDADWASRIHCILAQNRVPIDGAQRLQTQPVVID